jgi:hypothetical protein
MPVFAVAGDALTGFECAPDRSCSAFGDEYGCTLDGQCIVPADAGIAGAACIDTTDCAGADGDVICLNNKCQVTKKIRASDIGEVFGNYKDIGGGDLPPETNLASGLNHFLGSFAWFLAAKLFTFTISRLVESIEDWAPFGIPIGVGISIAFGGLDDLIDSILVLWFNMLAIGVLITLILWLGCVLLGWLLALNCGIIASSIVHTGFGIILGITNVGFVLALVVIAFATILRLKGYAMKNTLAKLIIAVLLINFSLFFIGLFLNVSNSITSAFLGGEACSVTAAPPTQNTGGPTEEGPTEKKAEEFTLSYWKKFNLFSVFDAVEEVVARESSTNFFVKEMILPIPNLLFAAIISLIAAVNIIFLIWTLIVRYVTLSILIIFSPLVWLSFIFPKLGGDLGNLWKEWWSTFIKWIIFLPVFSFFLYLVKLLLDNPGQLYNQGFLAYIGQLIVIVALLCGGLFAAKKLGIAGADKALAVAEVIGPAVAGGAAGMAWRRISAGASARWARRPAQRPPGPAGGGPGGGTLPWWRGRGGAPTWWPRPWTGPGGTGGTPGGGGTPGPGGTPGGRPGGGTPGPGGTPGGRPGGGTPGPGGTPEGRPGDDWTGETIDLKFDSRSGTYRYDKNDGPPDSEGTSPGPGGETLPVLHGGPTLETFTSPEHGEAVATDYFETISPAESSSLAGSEGEGDPDSSEGTPGGAPGGNDEDWEESFATWWDNESPSPAGPEEEDGPPPGDGGGAWWDNKLFRNVWRGVSTVTTPATSETPEKRTFDTSIIKAVISAIKAELGAKHKAGAGEKEKKEKEIKRLKDLEKTQKEEIERLETERRNRENEAS